MSFSKKIINENIDQNLDADLQNKNFANTRFIGLGAKERRFENCNFSFCSFEDGYFRGAIFVKCKFIGARFIDCNLKTATFENCIFNYARFERTHIDLYQVLSNLPDQANVCRDLMREHRINAESVGDMESSKRFILEELFAERRHWAYAAQKKTAYYSSHYPGFKNWIKIYYHRVRLWLDWHIWGHGEVPWKLAISSSIFVVAVSFITSLHAVVDRELPMTEFVSRFGHNFKDLLIAFLGGGTVQGGWFFQFSIVIAHFVFLGLFINILSSRMSKR